MEEIEINTEFIRLDQFLKYVDIVSSGGEARYWIMENNILVNGENEKRRGRKLRDGDVVSFSHLSWRIKTGG